MAETETLSPSSAGDADESLVIEPLTRGGCRRLPEVERQIAAAVKLGPLVLSQQARQRDETAPDFLSVEALVYFIRQSIRSGDIKTRESLFRELFERCIPYFQGQFRGFSREDREDLQSEVMRRVVEDLFAPDDRGDFMQVRFWKYLDNKKIDACRTTLHHTDDTKSLDEGYFGDGIFKGRTRLEAEADPALSPEEFAMISEGLAKLLPRLRRVFVLRHYFRMKIGADDPTDDTGDELTIAAQFSCSGRTIRNWLKEAERLLAGFRGEL